MDSGQLQLKTPKLSTQQILKQAPKTTEVKALSTMDSEISQGHSLLDQQRASVEKHMIPFERNTHPPLTLGVSNKT